MAGKHQGLSGSGFAAGSFPPFFPGYRLDRAYAEGRHAGSKGAVAGDNPHTAGEPEYDLWEQGRGAIALNSMELQTFIPRVI